MSAPDAATESTANPGPFTPREVEVMKKAWNCLKTVPEVDYHKLAEAMGVGSHRSAQNAWCAIKKKLLAEMPAAVDEDGNPVVATPKRKRPTPAKKKAAAPAPAPAGGGDGDEDELTTETENKLVVRTPKKIKATTPKKAAAKKTAAAAAASDGEDEQEPVPETPAKRIRAPKKQLDKSKLLKPEFAGEGKDEDGAEGAAVAAAGEAKFAVKEDGEAKDDVAMKNGNADEGNDEI